MAVSLSGTRHDILRTPVAEVLKWIDTQVQATAQEHLLEKHERMDTAARCALKARLIYCRTNMPLPFVKDGEWWAPSSDGHTLYPMPFNRETLTFGCKCPSHGPCYHDHLRAQAEFFGNLPDEHLPFGYAAKPIEAGDGQVRSMAGRSRLFHDEVA